MILQLIILISRLIIKMMKSLSIILLILPLILTSQPLVKQFNPSRFDSAIKTNQFTLVYFYTSTCQYCQTFTPKFEKLAKIHNHTGLILGKIDGPAYPQITEKYKIYSYPSITLFWQGIDAPIFYVKERQISNLLQFLSVYTKLLSNRITKQQLEKLTDQQRKMGIIYVGPIPSYEYNITSVLSYLQPYRPFVALQGNVTQPYLQIKGQQFYHFDALEMRKIIKKEFAFVHEIDEEAWLNIHQKKQMGIIYIDTSNKKNVVQILQKLAIQFYDVNFMKIYPGQDQYKEAIDHLGVESEQSLIGVDERLKAKFLANKPYTEESIRQFIKQVLNSTATLYMRSEKTNHKQKLTRNNYQEKVVNEPKDIVIFIYRNGDRAQNKFMDLFKFLTEKLKNNQNISLLRCNLSKNEIQQKLGFQAKVTPSIVFYGHRMKDKPVHFLGSTISAESVIEFIMENTTFDWEDQWGEL